MYVIPGCMSEIIDLTKNSIGNCKLYKMQFFGKYICVHGID